MDEYTIPHHLLQYAPPPRGTPFVELLRWLRTGDFARSAEAEVFAGIVQAVPREQLATAEALLRLAVKREGAWRLSGRQGMSPLAALAAAMEEFRYPEIRRPRYPRRWLRRQDLTVSD